MGLIFAYLQGCWHCEDVVTLRNLMLHISIVDGLIRNKRNIYVGSDCALGCWICCMVVIDPQPDWHVKVDHGIDFVFLFSVFTFSIVA